MTRTPDAARRRNLVRLVAGSQATLAPFAREKQCLDPLGITLQ